MKIIFLILYYAALVCLGKDIGQEFVNFDTAKEKRHLSNILLDLLYIVFLMYMRYKILEF